uniref:Uncharacterized protein n=1 Tax=Acrobeloides nanus TaxID=290746 RepID=A0A914DRD3_9BILA
MPPKNSKIRTKRKEAAKSRWANQYRDEGISDSADSETEEIDIETLKTEYEDIKKQLKERENQEEELNKLKGQSVQHKQKIKNLEDSIRYQKSRHDHFKTRSEELESEFDWQLEQIEELEKSIEESERKTQQLKEKYEKIKSIEKVYKQFKKRHSTQPDTPKRCGPSLKPIAELSKRGKLKRIQTVIETLQKMYGDDFLDVLFSVTKKVFPELGGQLKLTITETILLFQKMSLTIVDARISNIIDSNRFRKIPVPEYECEVWIGILLDKGKEETKLALNILNKDGPINSVENITLIGCYTGPENYNWLSNCFKEVAEEIDNLNFVTASNGTMYPVRKFFIGDYKCMSCVFGLAGTKCKYPCIYCTEGFEGKYGLVEFEKVSDLRPDHPFTDEDFSKTNSSLFKSIPPSQYNLPFLHIFLRIGTDMVNQLKKAIWRYDGKFLTENVINTKISEYYDNKDLTKISTNLSQVDEEIEDNQHKQARMHSIISDLEKRTRKFGDLTAVGDVCNNPDGCLAHDLELVLPRRSTQDWIQCSGKGCQTCECLRQGRKKKQEVIQPRSLNKKLTRFEQLLKEDFRIFDNKIEQLLVKKSELETDLRAKIIDIDNRLGTETQKFHKQLQLIGIVERDFFQQFTGNHLRKIMENIAFIIQPLSPELQEMDEIKSSCYALQKMAAIQNLTASKFMNKNEIIQFSVLRLDLLNHMKEYFPNVSIGSLAHIFFRHSEELVGVFQNLQIMTEQSIESLHHIFELEKQRTTIKDNFLKISRVMRWQYEKNLLSDCHESTQITVPLTKKQKEKATRMLLIEENEEEIDQLLSQDEHSADVSMNTVEEIELPEIEAWKQGEEAQEED